jgi:hypothetical protein
LPFREKSTGDFSSAESTLSGITPGSHIEENYLNFYLISMHYLQDTSLNASDSTLLYQLTYKCPFLDGGAVYQARALYDQIYQTNIIYTDEDCITAEHSYRINPYSSASEEPIYIKTDVTAIKAKSKPFSIKLYPNPAKDEVIIASSNINDRLNIEIRDVDGRQLFSQSKVLKSYTAKFKFDLIGGIYFVTLTDINGRRSHHKLIISK